MRVKGFIVGTVKVGLIAGFGAWCALHWNDTGFKQMRAGASAIGTGLMNQGAVGAKQGVRAAEGAVDSAEQTWDSWVPKVSKEAGEISQKSLAVVGEASVAVGKAQVHSSAILAQSYALQWALAAGAHRLSLAELDRAGLVSPQLMQKAPESRELKGRMDFDGKVQNDRALWWQSVLGEVPKASDWERIQKDAKSRVGFESMSTGEQEWARMQSALMIKNNLTPVAAKRSPGADKMYVEFERIVHGPKFDVIKGFIPEQALISVPGVQADQKNRTANNVKPLVNLGAKAPM